MTSSFAIRARDGVTVCVPDSLECMTTYVLCERGDWFEDELPFVRRVLRPGERFVDVGANHGVYSLAAAARVGEAGAVWAIEPASATAGHLRASVLRNGFSQLTVIQAALSDREGEGRLALQDNSELNALVSGESAATEAVTVETLDRCAADHRWEGIALLKLDAEGHEAAILRGGAEWLGRESPLVLFEIKHRETVELGLAERFAELGYAAYRLIPGLGLLAPFDPTAPLDGCQLNLFACKPDRAADLEARGLLTRAIAEPPAADPILWQVASGRFGRARLEAWAQDADVTPGWDRYQAALADALRARAPSLPPGERLGHLRRAYLTLAALGATEPTVPRLASLARVAAGLGERVVAVETLSRLADVLGDDLYLHEPYLTPCPRFDAVAPALTPTDALHDTFRESVLEQLEALGTFSSYFGGGGGLERLAAYGLSNEPMERRRRVRDLRAQGVRPSAGFPESSADPAT